MNVLAIGNSFSSDATRYLHAIARENGVKLEVANLYIGGCSLERHYRNMLSGERAYELCYNGNHTGFSVSMQEALLNREWDVITLQQASHFSFDKASYQPYITELAAFVRKYQPRAKILIHQTWAYEDGSARLHDVAGFGTSVGMLGGIKDAYAEAAKAINADGMIPSGEMFAALLKNGVPKIHRDTFHASFGLGRYALALLWYHILTGKSVKDDRFCDFDEPVTNYEQKLVRETVDSF